MASIAIIILTIALSLSGGFQQGFIAAVLNQPYVHINSFINETIHERIDAYPSKHGLNVIWSALNTFYSVAFTIGQFMAMWACKRFGRKGTALITCFFYIPGILLSTLSSPTRSFELLFIGRILWSLSNGINMIMGTVWLVECAPPKIRGTMSSMQEFSMALGALFTQGTGLPLSTAELWPYLFLPMLPFTVIALILFSVIPESHITILEKSGDVDKARQSLSKFWGVVPTDPSIDTELLPKPKKSHVEKCDEKRGVSWIFNPFCEVDDKLRVIRHAAWLGIMVKIAYVFTGARCLRAYSTFILHYLSKFSLPAAAMGSFVISLLRCPACFVPIFLVDRVGRRPLMIVSMTITVLSLVGMLVSILIGGEAKWATLVCFAVLVLINSTGLGSVSRFYPAELVPRTMLLESVAVFSGIETTIRIGVDFIFYPVANIVGVYAILVLLVPSAIFLFVIIVMCPETAGRNPQQVLNDLAVRKNIKAEFK